MIPYVNEISTNAEMEARQIALEKMRLERERRENAQGNNEVVIRFEGESIEKYQTPYLIWTNYETEINVEKNTSLAGLSTRVLANANIDMPWFYDYIYEFYKEYPVFEKRFIIDKNGKTLEEDTNNELIENYNIIQFDILFKKNIKIEE